MAKNEELDIEKLQARGLTCPNLKNMEKKQWDDAKRFRSVGFVNIADVEEQTAQKIKELRKKICLLR